MNEAMAYALPIISTKGDDTIIDLIDGNGYLLNDFGNVNEIIDAVKTFVSLPEDTKQTMSRRSDMIIKNRASLNNMVEKHVTAIEKVLL